MEIAFRLIEIVGKDNVFDNLVDCLPYSRDMSVHLGIPQLVVFAYTTKQVSEIIRVSYENGVPLVVRGGGTSVTGASLPTQGGIVLNLIRMNKILEINLPDHYVRIQPGVICSDLNYVLKERGYFFPPDPGSAAIATLGGMISTNASGIRAIKYGTTRDYVMKMNVILANGEKIEVGSIAPKYSNGYDLVRLFCSSEGTLGVISEAVIKVVPLPEYSISARFEFTNVEEASNMISEIFFKNIPLSTCEILDDISLKVLKKVIDFQGTVIDIGCIVMLELDGNRSAVMEYVAQVNVIADKYKFINKRWTDDVKIKVPLWEARHRLVPILSRLKPGYRLIPLMEDLGVPITKVSEAIRQIQSIGNKYGFSIATFGHIGDGNLHPSFIMDVKNVIEWEKAKKIVEEFVELTMDMKGTISAEHGIGLAKSPYIAREIGYKSLNIMQSIKDVLDPKNILNPGKMGFRGSAIDLLDKSCFDVLYSKQSHIISFGEKIDNEIFACIQCGFCRIGCPTYAQTGLEGLNARGRIIYAFNLLTGQVKSDSFIAARLYQCMLCLNCKYACPAQVDVAAIVQKARIKLVHDGFLPKVFDKSLINILKVGNPYGQSKITRVDSFPNENYFKKEADILLYLGCSTSYHDIKVIPSIMKILDYIGIDYLTLGNEEYCCGYLAYLVGNIDIFETVVRINLEKIKQKKINKIVTSCAGCYKTLSKLYPYQGFRDNYQIEHIVTFIEHFIDKKKIMLVNKGEEIKVVYHDPCDLGRHLGIYEPPRRIITALPGVELVEFVENRTMAKCCGGGGGIKGFDNILSSNIALERVKAAISLGVDVIVSSCPSCKSSLNQAAIRARKEKLGKVKILDITELVASRIN